MRKLVTAADVRIWLDSKEKTVYLEAGTIITPAARDAARDYGIEIVEGAAACAPSADEPARPESKDFDPAMIARVVEEVIAAMGFAKPPAYETDPSGFRLARGIGKGAVRSVFDGAGSPRLSAGLLQAAAIPQVREVKGGEIHYVLSGTVRYAVKDREYISRAGDAAFLPAGASISLTGVETARIFYVACQDN